MRDEDDDLLRAAEELGIDLSGVRATDGEAADEEAEGVDDTDAGEPDDDTPDEPDDAEVDLAAEIDIPEGDLEVIETSDES
jgi:DNA-directed RNA polymerase subunit beta